MSFKQRRQRRNCKKINKKNKKTIRKLKRSKKTKVIDPDCCIYRFEQCIYSIPSHINVVLKPLDREMDRDDVIDALSVFIRKVVEYNGNQKRSAPSLFTAIEPALDLPPFEHIREFILTIFDKRRLAPETGVMALILLLRTRIRITTQNWMRLVLVAFLLANKEAEDVYNIWNAKFVGMIPNLLVYEINMLEIEFLQRINYRLHVERATFNFYYSQLQLLIPERNKQEELPEPEKEGENSLGKVDSSFVGDDGEDSQQCSLMDDEVLLLLEAEDCTVHIEDPNVKTINQRDTTEDSVLCSPMALQPILLLEKEDSVRRNRKFTRWADVEITSCAEESAA